MSGKFLFVEFVTLVEGTGTLPQLRLDFPRYIFNPSTQLLRSFQLPFPELGEDDVGYLGIARQRKGSAGQGTASTIQIIAKLPFTFEAPVFSGRFEQETEKYESMNIVLHGFDSDGQLLVSVGSESVLLSGEQSWVRTLEADLQSAEYNGHVVVTHTFTNHGQLQREIIQNP